MNVQETKVMRITR